MKAMTGIRATALVGDVIKVITACDLVITFQAAICKPHGPCLDEEKVGCALVGFITVR